MKITIVGSGYVGLVAGACFADTGNTVYCLDVDAEKIRRLQNGEIPIYEPGLESLVKRGADEGRLVFTTSYAEALAGTEIVFLAVGTPPAPDGGSDLKYLRSAAESVARHMQNDLIVVNKSTVPIGSHQSVAEWMKPFATHSFDVVSNPEFLKEGSAIEDFLKPDRVVIGTEKESVYWKMVELYAPFVEEGNPIIRMDPISAELTKYACNSFLAARISFMNELAILCESVGGDIDKVRRGMSTDVRIGKHFLYAGVGYGGSCFPKDVQALLTTARQKEVTLGIIDAAEAANARQKLHLAQKVKQFYGPKLAGKTLAVWGLAFKPNTDDMREAPSLAIIPELIKAGARIRVYDPVATENARPLLGENQIVYCEHSYEALNGADALLIVTEWNEFKQVDLQRVKNTLNSAVIFDGRNIYSPDKVRDLGFTYYGIGRRTRGVI